ncbi:MAG: hypothetical protein WC326_06555 [Candidatus Delongbacteria bacterium]
MTLPGTTLILAGGWILRLAGLMLLLAAWRLARRAHELGLEPGQLAWLLPLALGVGWVKSRRAIRPVLAANARWLRGRERVPAWRVFQPRLLLFIGLMITLSAGLKRLAAESAWGLASLGALDLAVATALLLAAATTRRREPLPD